MVKKYLKISILRRKMLTPGTMHGWLVKFTLVIPTDHLAFFENVYSLANIFLSPTAMFTIVCKKSLLVMTTFKLKKNLFFSPFFFSEKVNK